MNADEQAVREARAALLKAAEPVDEAEDVPPVVAGKRRAECPECRGNNYVWMMDVQTLQRLVVDCPRCGGNRPVLPENSHRTGAQHPKPRKVKL